MHVSGAAIVIAVNLFVFGSDFIADNFNHIPAFEKFFLHVSGEHQVNRSPFELTLYFAMNPAPLMDTSNHKPLLVFQTMPAILFLLTFLLTILSFYRVLRLCEDNRTAVFDAFQDYPPPKRIS